MRAGSDATTAWAGLIGVAGLVVLSAFAGERAEPTAGAPERLPT